VAEWSKALAWKVSIRQKRIEGSNPSRSAIPAFRALSRRLKQVHADHVIQNLERDIFTDLGPMSALAIGAPMILATSFTRGSSRTTLTSCLEINFFVATNLLGRIRSLFDRIE
jgi:hypothetical protein